MYKAIKDFKLGSKEFKVGEDFPVELFEDRLLRGKKIGIKEVDIVQETKEVELIVEDVKVKTDEVEKSKKNKKEEILTDNSSDVEVVEVITEYSETEEK